MNNHSSRFECSEEKRNKIKATKTMTSLRRQNQVCKVYECKIVQKRLNKKQKEELQLLFLEAKWFYNHVLSMKKNGIKLRDINPTKIKNVKHFDKNKNEIETELKQLSSQEKQAIIDRMISNEKTISSLIKNKFQNHGQLQFKSEINCIPLKQYGNTYDFKSANKVRIAGVSGKVLVKTGNQLETIDELANANFIRKPDGYYLKITTFTNKENFKEKKQTKNEEIGIDFGIKNNIITSEGEKIDISVEESDRLKKLQKELFRRVKGSNNRNKTINLIKREYQNLSNKKQDKANKLISKLKQYSTIVIQDEQIVNWHKGWFGKQVQHSCMGLVKAKLKSLPQTIVLDRFIPTTKWCPNCHKKNEIDLDKRTYSCECGYSEDRDIHSAKNMLAIKSLIFKKYNFVPTEHREVTLMEFKTAIEKSTSQNDEVRRCQVFSLA